MGDGSKKYRVMETREKTIGNTTYIVDYCVPSNVTDEQFQQQTVKRVERLIMSDFEREEWRKKTT